MKRLFFQIALGCLCSSFLTATTVDLYTESLTEISRNIFEKDAFLFTGNSNASLADKIAAYLDIPVGKASVGKFNDGEIQIRIQQNVRNKSVFILQSTCLSDKQSVNDNLMELYLLVRTLKRASATTITAVIPYYGYARQDRKSSPRVPISAADVALMLEAAGVDRVVTVDLHCGQIQGFFHNAPVDNLYASTVFVPYFVEKGLKNPIIISPDAGGVDRAKKFLEQMGKYGVEAQLAIILKQRSQPGVVASMQLIGDVEDSDVIIVDDLCDTAGTLVQAAQVLKEQGARRVFAAITHPVFSGPALERIEHSVIDELVVSDTIPLAKNAPPNIQVISVAPLLGEAIGRIYLGQSISELFP